MASEQDIDKNRVAAVAREAIRGRDEWRARAERAEAELAAVIRATRYDDAAEQMAEWDRTGETRQRKPVTHEWGIVDDVLCFPSSLAGWCDAVLTTREVYEQICALPSWERGDA